MKKEKKIYSSRDIAEMIGCSHQTVCTWVERMGKQLPLYPGEVEEFVKFYRKRKGNNEDEIRQ